MGFQTNQVSTINVDSKTITLVSTPRRGEPIGPSGHLKASLTEPMWL